MSDQPPSSSAAPRILIACIGNIFCGDDGFGVEVAQRLMGRKYPSGVQVVDFGIRGVELAYTLLDGCDNLLLVDAVARGGAPGTLYLIEPALPGSTPSQTISSSNATLDAHSLDPVKVLAFAYSLGAHPGRVLLLGCEPERLEGEEDDMGVFVSLSEPVRAAIDEAVQMIDSLVEQLLSGSPLEQV